MSTSFLRDKLRASITSRLSKGNKYTLSAFIPFIPCNTNTEKDVQCSSLKERDTEQQFSRPQRGGRAAWKILLENATESGMPVNAWHLTTSDALKDHSP